MKREPTSEGLFDAAAEALILVDPAEPETVADLIGRLEACCAWFGEGLAEDHPALVAVEAARRLEAEGPEAFVAIESAFAAARTEAERAQRAASAGSTSAAGSKKRTPPAEKAPAEKVAPEPEAAEPEAAVSAPASDGGERAQAQAMPLAGDQELLRDFAVRAAEHLDDSDERLLALESDPDDREALDAVFRALHTIKGMAGFLALDAISTQAHDAESLLAEARSTGVAVAAETIQALFVAVDKMRAATAEATGTSATAAPESGETAPRESVAPVAPAALGPASAKPQPAQAAPSSSRAGTVRIEEARLDALLDTIGELVIAESMTSASIAGGADVTSLAVQISRLDKITRELQHMATSLRMVPLRATFRRMARLVRDLTRKDGKAVEFVTVGEDIELDKDVVDRIADPLVHLLRNAVDHGIEGADERAAAGKPKIARVELRAYHAGGAIHIEVADDGAGIDTQRILETAQARGIFSADERPDDRAINDLIFEPGFSTATQVTDVSGRGVGMDVVRRAVDELRGRIEIRTAPGEGTTISVRLPVTLAIIDGMIVRVGSERYVVPTLSIERSVRPASDEITTVAQRGLMLATDDGHVPVLRLHEFFNTTDAETDPESAVVVIVADGGVRAGLMVCELLGQQQTVIKPLGDGLPDQHGITGGAVLPDGRVGLILDPAGLIRRANETVWS